MVKDGETQLRKGDVISLMILEAIAKKPNISRNEIRKVVDNDGTIKKVLRFLETIGAVEVKKEPLGNLTAWRSTITIDGIKLLNNAGLKVEYKSTSHVKRITSADIVTLNKFLGDAHNLGFFPIDRWASVTKSVAIWQNAAGEKTTLLVVYKRVLANLEWLKNNRGDYGDSKELEDWIHRFKLTLKNI
jgi:hypothetical protein